MKNNSPSTSTVQAALAYREHGYFVVPIPPGKKHPVLTGWQDLRLTEDEIQKCFTDSDNIGLLLAPSNLVDVDCDCLEAVFAAKILLPPTEMVHGHRSNPASHYYYQPTNTSRTERFADPRTDSSDVRRAMIIEMRGSGQTVVPPSHHAETGEPIEWVVTGEPFEIDPAVLHRNVAKVASAALIARYWPQSQRHFAVLALSGMLAHASWSEPEITTFVSAVVSAAHDEEAASRIHDAEYTVRKFSKGDPVTGAPTLAAIVGDDVVGKVREWLALGSSEDFESRAHYTDLGNARRFVAQHGENLHFHSDSGKWLFWAGQLWLPDTTDEVERMAKRTVETLHSEAARLSGKVRDVAIAHALASESEGRLRAMVNVAKSEPRISVSSDVLDADPWLLNCLNGTLDLRTGKLLSHHRDNLCTKQALATFDPIAKCPTWDAFLNRIMAGNEALIQFLYRAMGYSLTGMTSEQILFFLYGTGANGKSTFIETIRKLLGDYAQQADFGTFLERRNEGPRNDVARLKGARFVAAVEAAEGRRLAENVIKQMTGGDTVTARFLYREFFEFVPQYKLFLVANHKPQIKGTDEAIWRRIRLVPFTVTIPPEERDKRLLEKLQAELPGILAWAVRGCLEWQEKGLGEPAEVCAATAEYRREMDILADFIEDRCVVGGGRIANAGDLYDSFKRWCEDSGEEPFSQKKFGTQLRERGFVSIKDQGRRAWEGLSFGRCVDLDGSGELDGSDA